eukprot:COSAG06_NODE_2241_length_7269_cov_9.419944_4_plen_180_part_00
MAPLVVFFLQRWAAAADGLDLTSMPWRNPGCWQPFWSRKTTTSCLAVRLSEYYTFVATAVDKSCLNCSTANCIIIAQFPLFNHSEQGHFAESPLKTIEKVLVWGDYYAIPSNKSSFATTRSSNSGVSEGASYTQPGLPPALHYLAPPLHHHAQRQQQQRRLLHRGGRGLSGDHRRRCCA